MNIYVDESGSINNHTHKESYFVIAMVHVLDREKLSRIYKRFVSANYDRLLELDADKRSTKTGRIVKTGGKMFSKGAFKELKGAQFDRDMKLKFVDFFTKKHYFNIYYIKLVNAKLTDAFCDNTARVFNYTIRLALNYFIKNGFLPDEDCFLQLDERNEKTETKYFLENYLNTELTLSGVTTGKFNVSYFDSTENRFIQIADIFANLFYSHLQTGQYTDTFEQLSELGILKSIFEFPIKNF